MTVTRKVLSLGLLAGLLAGTATAQAGETMIFKDSAPKAAELARILWPTKNRAQGPTGATRSIRINPDVVPEAAAAQPAAHVEYAETEATTATDVGPSSAPVVDSFGFLIHFGYDSAEILPESRSYLDSVGAMLRLPEAQGKKVKIVGHTDARGSEQYNQALSERRATAVRNYLKAEFGVASEQLEIMGEGERELVPGADPYAADNRRVEFHAAG
jgi:outer membrane protein OmpA-like peptidoglycan-associated protein